MFVKQFADSVQGEHGRAKRAVGGTYQRHCQTLYAQTSIVVVLMVMNFFGFLVITRHHGVGEVPGVVEMNPISFPDLFKPVRDLKNLKKHKILQTISFKNRKHLHD